jgi:hypothetical protein
MMQIAADNVRGMERLTSALKPQSGKNRNKGRTAANYRLCYCLGGMNALTDLLSARQRHRGKTITNYRTITGKESALSS